MKNYYKVIALIAVVATITACMVSCTQQSIEEDFKEQIGAGEGKILDDSAELRIIIGSHPSWPYNEDWALWQYLREAVGGNIEVQAIPNSEMSTKMSVIMASPNDLPDLIHIGGKGFADTYGPMGALIPIDDYLDKMPNYSAFWNSLSEDEREHMFMMRKSSDGKIYYPPIYGMERSTNVRSWMYRKDIFEKHSLKAPETMDELYKVASKLKTIYPDSYPLSMRSGLSNLRVIGPSWKPFFSPQVYYDFHNDTWNYGTLEDTMIEVVTFIRKLHKEGLIPPDFINIQFKSWEELVFNDRGFIMPEYQVRIDYFNVPARKNNPDFNLTAMMPPKANTLDGQNMVAKFNVDPTGYVICNTRDQSRIDNAVKFIDWMYSDEAAELLSWGKEGETFEVVNGKRKFIADENTPNMKYGVHTNGLYLRIIPAAADAVVSEEQAETTTFVLEHTEDYYNPQYWLALNNEEIRVKNDIGTAIDTYGDEMLSKYLLGLEPLSSWDEFIAEILDMGVNELLATYKNAYERIVQ